MEDGGKIEIGGGNNRGKKKEDGMGLRKVEGRRHRKDE